MVMLENKGQGIEFERVQKAVREDEQQKSSQQSAQSKQMEEDEGGIIELIEDAVDLISDGADALGDLFG